MESYLPISYLNDFVFCPRSIYFHQLHGQLTTQFYHTNSQRQGLAAHDTIDNQRYSTSKHILQSLEIHSEKYQLNGKIDYFNNQTGELVERKKQIKTIYDGYRYQLYAQYHCLTEMGYHVSRIKLYSMDDNKNHPIPLPHEAPEWQQKFETLIHTIRKFDLTAPFNANSEKCNRCVYHSICDHSLHTLDQISSTTL